MGHYLAFDLGAESGRAMLGTLAGRRLRLEELHRFLNQPVSRTLEESMDVGWKLLAGLPKGELTRLSDAQIAAHIPAIHAASVGFHP